MTGRWRSARAAIRALRRRRRRAHAMGGHDRRSDVRRGLLDRLLRQVAPRQSRRPTPHRPGLRRVVRHPAHDRRGALALGRRMVEPEVMPAEQVMEGRKGEKSRELEVYDVAERRADRRRDHAPLRRVHRAASEGRQAVLRLRCHHAVHLPTLPNPGFAGKTGNGDWADMLAEMDHQRRPDPRRHRQGRRRATTRSSSSPATTARSSSSRGTAGPGRGAGAYFTALEGGIRVPFLIRWPGKIPAGRVSNEIVHGVDMFATLAKIAGATVRPTARSTPSTSPNSCSARPRSRPARDSRLVADRLQAVKWRNWKMHLMWQDTMFDPPVKNPVPTIHNLLTDPAKRRCRSIRG